MNVENPFAAKAKMQHLRKYLPVAAARSDSYGEYHVDWTTQVEYQPVFELADNLKESMEKMNKIEELTKEFPGLDCGCCGAPTCKALAEDIVKGIARKQDCIHVLREYIHKLSEDIAELSEGI